MARCLRPRRGMVMPLAAAYAEREHPAAEQHVPEVVPIEDLTARSIEEAEAEIEAEEQWQRTD